uniref:Upstream transcription factor family member 3 n=1 Tax=Leptobrachium leishanense TaxID=445787 RepID=A0A8C5QHN2_9ANUR
MPEMTQNETPIKSKHRKKNRESHNEVERHRKKKINSGINRIGDLIPCSPALKQSKNMILDQAFKYITELKKQNDELLLNGGDQEQASEIKKLRKQLAKLQKENARYIDLLKSNDICLYDDPTLHWKGKVKNVKASPVVPPDQAQKLPLCINGSQLSSSNQVSSVHGITFNVGQNLQKQTANVVPVQRTCNLVTPVTISGLYPIESKNIQQGSVLASTSSPHTLCLPVTSSVPSSNDVLAPTSLQNALPASSAAFFSCLNGSTKQVQRSSSQTSQEGNTSENVAGQHLDTLTINSSMACTSLSSNLVPLVSEVSQATVSAISLTDSSAVLQGRYLGVTSCAETVNDVVREIFSNIDIVSGPEVTVSSVTTAVENQAVSATMFTSTPLESSWSLSSTLSPPEMRNVSSLPRISSDGNTQTTWTTLQLAGNTIQPLSQASSAAIPMLLAEQQTCSKAVHGNLQTAACVNLNNLIGSEGRTLEVVKMPSCQQIPVQSLISQQQAATNILPLNPPVQVIQVAPPVGPVVNPAPANQNIIFLQPPTPAPCQPILRTDVPKPAVGQQIVIIQTSPTQTPLPIMSAQASSSVVMPINAANHVVCATNSAQSPAAPQTFGGKHLVHILPRPTTVSSANTVPSVPVSTVSSNQQPPTISLNGHLFALQPVTPSAGTTNLTPMQIIQPTTSEDPKTNVALNAFGALANLSQSISQMAGQSCLQFTVNHPAASITDVGVTGNCAAVGATNMSSAMDGTQGLPVSSSPTKLFPGKTAGGSSSPLKPKKTPKKPSSKKSTAKEPVSRDKSDSLSLESSKKSNGENLGQLENSSLLLTASNTGPEKPKSVAIDTNPLEGLNTNETGMSSDCASDRSLPVEFSGSSVLVETQDVLLNPHDHIIHSESAVAFKVCPLTSVSTEPSPNHPVQEAPNAVTSPDQTGVKSGGISSAAVSKPSALQEESSSLTATDLLEVQILSDDPKGISHTLPQSMEAKDLLDSRLFCRKTKTKDDMSEHGKADPLLLITSTGPVAMQQPFISVQEIAVSSSCITGRQTDSPLSTSSMSSRNFSVASMLPDASSREDIASSTMAATAFNGCAFTEQNDIVAVAARVIFDQEHLSKVRARTQTEVRPDVSRDASEMSSGNCRDHYKTQLTKESDVHVHSTPVPFNPLDSGVHSGATMLSEKTNLLGDVGTTNPSLLISASQNVTSLSINNLVPPSGVHHPNVNFVNTAQVSSASSTPTTPSHTYKNQTHAASGMSDFSQEQLHAMRATVMQATRSTDSVLKPDESRKASNKRCAHDDVLLSAVKRQKQCPALLRHERLQPQENLTEQKDVLAGHVPPNNSSSMSSNNQGQGDGLSNLFPSNSNFVNTHMRQTEMRCSSQPVNSEQSQMGTQQLQSMQQHTPNQVSLLHSQYLKQQQHQASHLREQHHLYQQQHHVSLADTAVHSQPHNVQQQRLMQHDVQMQKKRSLLQGSQAGRLSIQQEHHLSDQSRQKGGQQHTHHQQIQQQMPSHFGSTQVDKTCENNAVSRNHHGSHPQSHVNQEILHQHQQDVVGRSQGSVSSDHLSGHNPVQRHMTSRVLEQQMVSQSSIVSRPTNMTCAPHRQERNRVSSYSAEALIGKSTSNSEQRMGIAGQNSRLSDQLEMRKYLDISRNKGLSVHNLQSRMPIDHSVNADGRLVDCQTFKASSTQQQSGVFEVQTTRHNEVIPGPPIRNIQSQAYRMSQIPNSSMERQKHLPYQPVQDVPITNSLPIRDNENSCHQSFMQGLLTPFGEQVAVSQRSMSSGHQRPQYTTSGTEYGCPPTRETVHLRRDGDRSNRESCDLAMGQVTSRNNSLSVPFTTSSGEVQGRNASPHSSMQKSNSMRPSDSQGSKNHLNIQVSINMHGVVHPAVPHQPVSHGNVDQRQIVRQGNLPIAQRSRHHLQEEADSKVRQSERNRSANQRHSNMFDPSLPHLPLAGPGSMILGRQQPVTDKRAGIVRFMPESPQMTTDNPTPDQHSLTQNFGFPFIPEGTMNPPINTNPSFIPPVTQTTATRTPALIPVDPQNTIPSFYPSYSPAHPSLPNDITIPYFSNQMFPNPSTEKPNSTGLNNRFGSILSPPRPVGFSQTTFPLLPDMTPMHMTNPSHLSNFNLTSLFPEIATALPADGSAMSPLLPISHTSNSDSSKQSSNRPAHNISHILGHDSSSTV